jgi:hypothetical protein
MIPFDEPSPVDDETATGERLPVTSPSRLAITKRGSHSFALPFRNNTPEPEMSLQARLTLTGSSAPHRLPRDRLQESLRQRVGELVGMGHRGSATANEGRAAEYLLGKLNAAGMEAAKEAFAGSRSMGARLLVHVLFAMISLAFLNWLPLIAALIATFALASIIAEQMTRGPWLSRMFCRATSYNVVGRVPARTRAARRVVLCAHYDTQQVGWIWVICRWLAPIWARCPSVLKPPLLTLGLLMAGNVVIAAIAVFVRQPQTVWVATWLIGAGYASFAILLGQWTIGRSVPGGADNASGVVAVMKIAETWRDDRPADDVELIVLFSGCEETGVLGTAAWVDRYHSSLTTIPTKVLNLDGLGFGPPRFLGKEVPALGLPLHAPAPVITACSEVAGELGLIDAGPHALPGPTDGVAFLSRGIQCITIVGFSDGQRLSNYHTMSDAASNADFAAVCLGTRFAMTVAWKLAKENPHT